MGAWEVCYFLWEAGVRTQIKRVNYFSIQPLHHQHDGQWETNDHNMALQRHQNITCWLRGNNKNNRVDEGYIRESHEGVPWEEAWLTWNEPWFIGIWRGQGEDDRLPEEDCVWLYWNNRGKIGNPSSRTPLLSEGRRYYEYASWRTSHGISSRSHRTSLLHSPGTEGYIDRCGISNEKGENPWRGWLSEIAVSVEIY